MKTLELANATKSLADYAKGLGDEILVLTSGSKPVAAMISLKGIDFDSVALSTNPEFLEIVEFSRKELRGDKKISLTEMKKEISRMD